MTDSTRKGGAPAQYAAGILLCLVGGFFAVSIVLALAGQEPTNPGALTWAVAELLLLLGTVGALVLSAGVAVIGALLIVRDEQLPTGRFLVGLTLCAVASAGLLAVIGRGGELFQALLPGFVGKALDFALGAGCLWGGGSLLLGTRGAPRSTDVVRIGLGARADAASGVSAAEAELLVPEPRGSAFRPIVKREEPKPVPTETIKPYLPRKEVPEPARTRRVDPPAHVSGASPAKSVASARTPEAPAPARPTETSPAPASEVPLTPSWELDAELVSSPPEPGAWTGEPASDAPELDREPATFAAQDLEDDEEEQDEDEAEVEEDEAELDELEEEAGLVEAVADMDDEAGETAEEAADEDAEEEAHVAASPTPPRVSWEQVGLFDEEEEELVEPAPPSPEAARELTRTFDFEPAPPPRRAHEPEPAEPSAVAPARPGGEPRAAQAPAGGTPAAPSPAPVGEFVLEPRVAPSPAAVRAAQPERDDEGERWRELVFEAGCAILEQKRVAVSMLERRFGIDFDQACRVLDELQQSGLIGPYMGGRTRDILLSREEWLAQAPHAS